MKVGKICTIGDSTGVVIQRAHLEQLGWLKGDHITQEIHGDTLVVKSLQPHITKAIRRRKEYATSDARSALRAR